MNKTALLGFATLMMGSVKMNQEDWKKRILDEWEKSKNYPRKKRSGRLSLLMLPLSLRVK